MSKQAQLPLQNSLSSLKVEGKGGSTLSSATQLKLLNKFVDKILMMVEQEESPDQIECEIVEATKELNKELRKRELEALQLTLTKNEVQLSREKTIDKHMMRRFDVSYQIIEKAIESRKKSYRDPKYPIEDNILKSGPFWSGSKALNSKMKEIPIPDRPPTKGIEKKGLKTLKYKNDLGIYLSRFDQRVLLGITTLWFKKGKPEIFSFHERELLEIINLTKGGSNYKFLEESIRNLYNATIEISNFEFYENGNKKSRESVEFRLISSHGINEQFREADGKTRKKEYIIELAGPVQKGFYKYISLSVLDDLESDTAQGLYMELHNAKINRDGFVEFNCRTLCELLLGLEGDQRPAKYRGYLEKACEQLQTLEIITKFLFLKDQNKNDIIRIYPTDWFAELNRLSSEQQEPIQLDFLHLT